MNEKDNTSIHWDLVTAHRTRYHLHAQALLDDSDAREVRYRDDCGMNYHPIDRFFVQGMEAKVGFDDLGIDSSLDAKSAIEARRRELCRRIANNESVLALDAALSAYVVRLTGRPI